MKDEDISLLKEIHVDELHQTGIIPHWLSGILIRNGPAQFHCGKKKLHWLDGLAMLHAFSFHQGKVSYTNQFLKTAWYRSAQRGKMPYRAFATDPCRSLFKDLFSFYYSCKAFSLSAQNTNVNVTKIANHFVALTEVPLSVEFDPKTLDTLGVFRYEDDLNHRLRFESAHPHDDFHAQEKINYTLNFGSRCFYTFYRILEGSASREKIAEIPTEQPAYMHSFSLTENFLILTEYPFRFHPKKLLWNRKAFIHNFAWKPEGGTHVLVIDRRKGKLIKTLRTESFFAFHHVNAFETENKIVLDLVTYKDPSLITKDFGMLSYEDRNLRRLHISLKEARIDSELLHRPGIEMPRLHPHYDGKDYTYVYGVGIKGELVKVDVRSRQCWQWFEEGCFTGEPIFVPTPDSQKEDEGVILAVILDQLRHLSFLLILNAETFEEMGRAEVPHAIPLGLHGNYFKEDLTSKT